MKNRSKKSHATVPLTTEKSGTCLSQNLKPVEKSTKLLFCFLGFFFSFLSFVHLDFSFFVSL